MKLVIILVLFSIGAVAALGFLGQQMGIDPIKVEAPKLPSFNLPQSSSTGEVYKWQDSEGQWHFGDAPPDNAGMLQQVNINTEQNVIRAFETKAAEPETNESASTDTPAETNDAQPTPGQAMLLKQQQMAEEKMQSAPITPSELLMKLQQMGENSAANQGH